MIRSTHRRGRHKVFIGMAPGVGKTCRMLQEGKEVLREGTDVVVGLLETHGRQETARQAEGLEQIPRKQIRYQDVDLEEMDVAAVLARRPQLVLVDELAHTNVPGSEREKRWQDVEMLLLSGLDVYSTLNIQHLESLNDLVAELTGVVVRERIPNRVLELADEVVLVDVTPETLQERLREGKVYAPEKVGQALANFFQRRHLVALRELSLREVADRVENDILPSATHLRERVMVCLANYQTSKRLLRRAARLAAAMDAPLLALTVQDPNRFLSREESLIQEECRQLCEDVGASFERVESAEILPTIAKVAEEKRITQIVLGQTMRSRLRALFRRPLSERLQHQLRGLSIDLHLISEGLPLQKSRIERTMSRSGLPIGLVWASWLVILLLELATPTGVVLGILYVIPLVIGAAQRSSQQAWRFLIVCCAATLLNLFVPAPPALNVIQDLANRLLVCLSLTITTLLLIRNQTLEQQRIALDVQLAQAQLRGDVIATLAHDLKTPVLGTLASLALLENNKPVRAIRSSQERCLRLIEDLLQVFRAEQEGLNPELKPCNLLAIAQEALGNVEAIAAQREIEIVLRQPQAGPRQMVLNADPSLLLRLLENLLLNAVHHSLRGQRVWLQLSHAREGWLVDVCDSGTGFPPEELPKLFQRFSQTSSTRGTGLGLFLCRLISEAHGGSIRASNSPGGGARVVVQLPGAEV